MECNTLLYSLFTVITLVKNYGLLAFANFYINMCVLMYLMYKADCVYVRLGMKTKTAR